MSQPKDILVVITLVERSDSDSHSNDDSIRSRNSTQQYVDGWERIFGAKKETAEELPN